MSRIPSGVVFHCDATYKIVKVGYPLIVFGISDINRKFYPICFMFTSHEQNKDYVKFFTSLKKLAIILNILLSPEYMCIDASKCMAKKFTKITNTYLYEYSHKHGNISTINYMHKTCTCSYFNDRAMCVHLIKVATLEKVLIPGLEIDNKFSINYRRKQLKKKI